MTLIILPDLRSFIYLVFITVQLTAGKPGLFTYLLLSCQLPAFPHFVVCILDGCGIRANIQTRIVGGEVSFPGKWPWMAGNISISTLSVNKKYSA